MKREKSTNQTAKAQTYLTPPQFELLEKRRKALKYPDKAKYIRRLLIEGMRNHYPYEAI